MTAGEKQAEPSEPDAREIEVENMKSSKFRFGLCIVMGTIIVLQFVVIAMLLTVESRFEADYRHWVAVSSLNLTDTFFWGSSDPRMFHFVIGDSNPRLRLTGSAPSLEDVQAACARVAGIADGIAAGYDSKKGPGDLRRRDEGWVDVGRSLGNQLRMLLSQPE